MELNKIQKIRKDATDIFELAKGFTGQPSNPMKSLLDMAGYVLELTNEVKQPILTGYYTKEQLIAFGNYYGLVSDTYTAEEGLKQWSEVGPSTKPSAPSERPAPKIKTKNFNLEEWIKRGSKTEDILYPANPTKIIQATYLEKATSPIILVFEGGSLGCFVSDFDQLKLVDHTEPVYLWRNVYPKYDYLAQNNHDEQICIQAAAKEKVNGCVAICRVKFEETAPGQYVFIEAIPYS